MTRNEKHVYEAAKELGYSEAAANWWAFNGTVADLNEDTQRANAIHVACSIRN